MVNMWICGWGKPLQLGAERKISTYQVHPSILKVYFRMVKYAQPKAHTLPQFNSGVL